MDGPGKILYKSNMQPSATILNFSLFGEAGELPDVVHCESIEARSRLHDWELAPHRHARLHQVLLFETGAGRATLDGIEQTLEPMTLVNVPIGRVHGFSFAPGTVGIVITLAAELLDTMLRPSEGLIHVLANTAAVPAPPECAATVYKIAKAFSRRDRVRAQLLRSLTGLLLGQVADELIRSGLAESHRELPQLLVRFEALLEEHFLEHWTVRRYARALAVTPTHLSRLTRNTTGHPASRLIRDRLILEARRNLVYTNLSVSEIAFELGFKDPAYFSRVFAQATDVAPSEFRTRVTQSQGKA